MYFNVVGDGVTELFKTAYKVVPVNIVDGEFSVPEKHPLQDFVFEEYDYCFNFLKDFYEHRDKFFSEDGYGYNWDKEAFEGFDHFDILHVVFKTTERNENGATVSVLSETVASVKCEEEYPFALTIKPENTPVEGLEEIAENTVAEGGDIEDVKMTVGKLSDRVYLLERLLLSPDVREKEDIVKQMGYYIAKPETEK